MTERVTGTLQNWRYDPIWKVFWGDVYGDIHGRFDDGINIHTSHCPHPEAQEGDVIQTLNSTYLLGKPL